MMLRSVLLLPLALLNACHSSDKDAREYKPVIPKTQAEAGTVYISPYPPLAWDEVALSLQPNFSVKSADDLLAAVLPSSFATNSAYRTNSQFGFGANLAGPNISKTSTRSTTTDLVADEVTEGSLVNEKIRTLSTPDSPDIELSGGSPDASSGIAAGFTPGMDPGLSYRAATALYQQIKLLNSYLSARLNNGNEVAYLFRVQVTVQPFRRYQPVDVYSRIWVEPSECSGQLGTVKEVYRAARSFAVELSKESFQEAKTYWADVSELTNKYSDEILEYELGCRNVPLKIIPILIAESGERASADSLIQAVSAFDASLSATTGAAGLGAAIQRLKDDVQSIRGQSYNNLVSVSQSAPDELIVRFGAAYSPVSEFEMQTRTYDISFLVLLPKYSGTPGAALAPEYGQSLVKQVEVLENTIFRNSLEGSIIPLIDSSYINRFKSRLGKRLEFWDSTDADSRTITNQILRGEFEAVRDTCLSRSPDNSCSQTLHENRELFEIASELEKAVRINVSRTEIPNLSRRLPPPQTAYAVDKPSADLKLFLAAAPGFDVPDSLVAAINAISKGNGENVVTLAHSLEVTKSGALQINFPSMRAAGISADTHEIKLTLAQVKDDALITARMVGLFSEGQISSDVDWDGFVNDAIVSKQYDVIFDNVNSGPPTEPKIWEAKVLPETPKVAKDGELTFRLRLARKTKDEKKVSGVLVTLGSGMLEQVTLVGSIVDPAGVLVAGAKNPDVRKALNQFTAQLDNVYEVTLSGIMADEELGITIDILDESKKKRPLQKDSISTKLKALPD